MFSNRMLRILVVEAKEVVEWNVNSPKEFKEFIKALKSFISGIEDDLLGRKQSVFVVRRK